MRKYFWALIGFFNPFEAETLDYVTNQKITIAIGIVYIGSLFFIINTVTEISSGLYLIGSIDIIAVVLMVLLSFLFKYEILSLDLMCHGIFLIILVDTAFSTFYTGGALSINILWLVFLPLLAQIFFPDRYGTVWFLLVAGVTAGIFSLTWAGYSFPSRVGERAATIASDGMLFDRLIALVGFMTVIHISALLFKAGVGNSLVRMRASKENSERLNREITEILSQIKENAEVLDSSSSGIVETNKVLERNSALTMERTETVAGSSKSIEKRMELLSEDISTATKGMGTIADYAARARETAEKGTAIAGGIGRLMKELQKEGQESVNIATIIQQTSNQLKLLSVNAGIEAANAREHGQDFGVVAEQVKTLAIRTSEATADIANIIKTLQSTTNNSASFISLLVSTVQSILGLQDVIAQSVDEQRKSTSVISDNLAKTVELSSSIMREIEQIEGTIKGTREEVNKTFEDVTGLSTILRSFSDLIGDERESTDIDT